MISSIFAKVVISTLLASQVSAFATPPCHHGISIPASLTSTAMAASNDLPPSSSRRQALSSLVSGLVATTTAASVATVWGGNAEVANAEGSRVIGQISGSGLVFKVRHDIMRYDAVFTFTDVFYVVMTSSYFVCVCFSTGKKRVWRVTNYRHGFMFVFWESDVFSFILFICSAEKHATCNFPIFNSTFIISTLHSSIQQCTMQKSQITRTIHN